MARAAGQGGAPARPGPGALSRRRSGRFGLLDRACPHRGADLAFGRREDDGLRCPFHGWKFAVDGTCLETPAEPRRLARCASACASAATRCRSAPASLFAWLGAGGLDAAGAAGVRLPSSRRPSHSFAFKGLWHCNWLQAFEVGIDPAHPSFLHRYLNDGSLADDDAYGRQFRAASAGDVGGERWPMTRVMREFHQPEIRFERVADGLLRLTDAAADDRSR